VAPVQGVRRVADEILDDRNIGPEVARKDQLEPGAQTGARAQDLPASFLLDRAGIVQTNTTAVEIDLEKSGVLPNVRIHGVLQPRGGGVAYGARSPQLRIGFIR